MAKVIDRFVTEKPLGESHRSAIMLQNLKSVAQRIKRSATEHEYIIMSSRYTSGNGHFTPVNSMFAACGKAPEAFLIPSGMHEKRN